MLLKYFFFNHSPLLRVPCPFSHCTRFLVPSSPLPLFIVILILCFWSVVVCSITSSLQVTSYVYQPLLALTSIFKSCCRDPPADVPCMQSTPFLLLNYSTPRPFKNPSCASYPTFRPFLGPSEYGTFKGRVDTQAHRRSSRLLMRSIVCTSRRRSTAVCFCAVVANAGIFVSHLVERN